MSTRCKHRKLLIIVALGLCAVLFSSIIPSFAADRELPADIPEGWSRPAVEAALENGIIKGDANGLIRPGSPLKRSELAAVMNRVFGKSAEVDMSGFSDVEPGAWYYGEIASAVGSGWLKGFGGGLIKPENTVTREQFFTVIARALGLTDGDVSVLNDFSDGTDVSDWAKGPVSAMIKAGYVNGAGGALKPGAEISREEMCQVIYNAFATIISEPGVYSGLSGSVIVNCSGVVIKDSDLTVLCVGNIGPDGTVLLLDSGCRTLLGSTTYVMTDSSAQPDTDNVDDEQPADDETEPVEDEHYTPWPVIPDTEPPEPEPEEEPEPLPEPGLKEALEHFAENRKNLTLEITEEIYFNNKHLQSLTSTSYLDGPLELVETDLSTGDMTAFMFDFHNDRYAENIEGAFWENLVITTFEGNYLKKTYSLHGLSLNVEPEWFEEIEDGVYSMLPDHRLEAAATIVPNYNEYDEILKLELTVSNGVIEKISFNCFTDSDYYTQEVDGEIVITGFGKNTLAFPDIVATCTPFDIYTSPEVYVGQGYFHLSGLNVLSFDGETAYVSDNKDNHSAIPMDVSKVAQSVEEGKVYTAVCKVTETGNEFLPYILDVEVVKPYKADFEPLKACSNFRYVDYALNFGVFAFEMVNMSVTEQPDGSYILTDKNGDTRLFIMDHASDELRSYLLDNPGINVNMGLVIASTDREGNIVVLPVSTTDIKYHPELYPSGKAVPVGTDIDDILSDIIVIDSYTDEILYIYGDPDLRYEYDGYDPDTPGEYEITAFVSGDEIGTLDLRVFESVRYDPEQTAGFARFKDLDPAYYVTPSLPSISGDGEETRVLVIPVAFRDFEYTSPHLDDLNDYLDICYNDTTGATGWYSLREYYELISYGKLRLKADICDIYTTDYNVEDIVDYKDVYTIANDALDYFDDEIDYSLYDNDGDGDLDCVYFVYLLPENMYDYASYIWAYNLPFKDYVFENYTIRSSQLVLIGLDFFDLSVYDFLLNDDGVYANCQCLIHETGHALGLDDYYWTDHAKNLIGGTEMMDSNTGSMTSYSRILLSWADPTILHYYEVEDMHIGPLEETGDVIMITKDADEDIYGESFMISLYTPVGPNTMKTYDDGLFSIPGIVVYHISNELPTSIYEVLSAFIPGAQFKGENQISLYRNASKHYDTKNRNAKDSDLFQTGDTVTLYWDDGSEAMILTVNSADMNGASVTLTLP